VQFGRQISISFDVHENLWPGRWRLEDIVSESFPGTPSLLYAQNHLLVAVRMCGEALAIAWREC
jgi:hypothetical protein